MNRNGRRIIWTIAVDPQHSIWCRLKLTSTKCKSIINTYLSSPFEGWGGGDGWVISVSWKIRYRLVVIEGYWGLLGRFLCTQKSSGVFWKKSPDTVLVIFYVGILASIPTKKNVWLILGAIRLKKYHSSFRGVFHKAKGADKDLWGTEAPLKWSPIMAEVRVFVISVSRCLCSQMMFDHGNLWRRAMRTELGTTISLLERVQ